MSEFYSSVSIVPLWLWPAFLTGILVLLAIDLSLFGKQDHKSSTKSALIESALWISVALAFNAWFAFRFGAKPGVEFLTGYLVEKSLSVDNLFIILLIFQSFKIPSQYQHRILFYGVLGAVLMRGVFILAGAKLLHSFHWILYIFGAILIVTAVKFLKGSDEPKDVRNNWAVRVFKRFFRFTDRTEGNRLFVKEGGRRAATPLFLALIVIEFTDLVFAVDSIPAVFAVTQDAFIAFASNILAVLGLRALYFVLVDWVGKLRYLKPGLATILGFIGIKMLILEFVKIPSWVSLLVISLVLTTAGLSSWYVSALETKRNLR